MSKGDKKILLEQFGSNPEYQAPQAGWWVQPETHFDDALPLTLVLLDGSGWSVAEVVEEVRAAEQVFSQCKVSFSSILLVEVAANQAMEDMQAPPEEEDTKDSSELWDARFNMDVELLKGLGFSRPLVFFRKFADSYSYPESLFAGASDFFSPLSGTAYVTSHSRGNWTDALSTAHELAHLLADDGGHNALPDNLLCLDYDQSDGNVCGSNAVLTAEQCARVTGWLDRHSSD